MDAMHIMHMHTVDLLAGSRIEERIRVVFGAFFNLSLLARIYKNKSALEFGERKSVFDT